MKPLSSDAAVRRCRPLLGTFVAIELADARKTARALHAMAEGAFAQIARVHALMNFHDPASELSQLNRTAHLAPLRVHAWTRAVIAVAVRFGERSGGIFDVTAARTAKKSRATDRDIFFDDEGRIGFRQPLRIDLGGIAKGFAVDRAAEFLVEKGVRRAVINAGGDLRFVGERPARIAVRDPAAPHDNFFHVPLGAPAVATSAAYFSGRGHLVDPRTRSEAHACGSATVFAPTCVQADALTKIVLLAGEKIAREILRSEEASCFTA